MTITPFSHVLSSALVEALEQHTDHLPGDKIYGATLVRTEETLLPWFAVLADLGDSDGPDADASPVARWCPERSGIALRTPRLTEVCALFDAHLDAAPALARALGSHDVRQTFARLGAEPILYIFDRRADGEGTIEPGTFGSLNAGRESEPYYLQAARLFAA